jgi:hypothetical protein
MSLIISLILIGITLYGWRNTYKVDNGKYRRIILTWGQFFGILVMGLIPAINILLFIGLIVYYLVDGTCTFSLTDITGKDEKEVNPSFSALRQKVVEFLKKEFWK